MEPSTSTYSPLSHDNREIRVVIIEPSLERSMPIRCTTRKISLNNSPTYHALSYAWGDPTVTASILLNDVETQVTTNLEAALRHMRLQHEQPEQPELRWWIDAICINQSDPVERGQQVHLMRDIYSEATGVFVWLGEELDDGKLALETMQRLMECHQEAGWNIVAVLDAINRLQGTAAFKAIIRFFERSWWSRLWTVQEVVFAKEILVACGNVSLPWDFFHHWSRIVVAKNIPTEWTVVGTHDFLKILVTQGCADVFTKSFLRMEYLKHKSTLLDLQHILGGLVDNMECTDPRDRIYGTLGLAIDSESFDRPDYTISVSTLYIKVATIMVQRHQDLAILYHAPPRRPAAAEEVALPSWVPDWTPRGYPRPLNIKAYSAAKGRKALARLDLSSLPILFAQGVVWDIVTALEKPESEHRRRKENPDWPEQNLSFRDPAVTGILSFNLTRRRLPHQ